MTCSAHAKLLATLLVASAIVASAQSKPAAKPSPPKSTSTPAVLDPGTFEDGVYRNPSFGFACKVPYGWVLRTKEIAGENSDTNKGTVLLAAFERPPEAAEQGLNSTILIAAEPASNYPGLKQAVDYFDALTEVAKQKGFKVVNESYAFPIGTRQLVRADFSKDGDKSAYQSSIVLLSRGYIMSFTFIAPNEDDVDELVENLGFPATKKSSAAKPQ